MNILREFVYGILVSFVPIYGLMYFYNKDTSLNKKLGDYKNIIKLIPIFYGITNTILAIVLYSFMKKYDYNFIILKAFIFGFIMSIYGRYKLHMNEYVFHLPNDNLIHVFIPLLYIIVYSLIIMPLNTYIFTNNNISL